MNDSKLPQAIIATGVSIFAAVLTFLADHIALVSGVFAVAAAIYAIRASRKTIEAATETKRLRKMQQRKLIDGTLEEEDTDL